MPLTYQESDVHLRYDRGRTLSADAASALKEFLRRHAPDPINSVVDLGCGTGRFTAILAEAFCSPVIGVEPAENMRAVAEAKQHSSAVRFLNGSAERIPLGSGAADFVFMSQVLHHIADKTAALQEIMRVLRPRGRLVLRQTTRDNLDSYFYQRFFPEARAIDERRLLTRSELVGLAVGCAYVQAAVETFRYEIAATPDEYVERIALRTYSDLEYIPDESFHEGLAAFREYRATHPDFPRTDELDLFVFERC